MTRPEPTYRNKCRICGGPLDVPTWVECNKCTVPREEVKKKYKKPDKITVNEYRRSVVSFYKYHFNEVMSFALYNAYYA